LDIEVEAKAKELAWSNLNLEYCQNTALILE
jgi:hypothetical protein